MSISDLLNRSSLMEAADVDQIVDRPERLAGAGNRLHNTDRISHIGATR